MVSSRNNGFWKQVGKAARVAVGLQPGDVAPTTAQMMRLLSKYFPASPLPLLPSSVLSLSLPMCESAYPSTPLSLSFFSLISFILTTTNFQLGKHTHTHCHLFRNNVE